MNKKILNLNKLKPIYFDNELGDLLNGDPQNISLPSGMYAEVIEIDGRVFLRRDPLGCHKLFFSYDKLNTRLVTSNKISDLVDLGIEISAIHSCPPGSVIEVIENIIKPIKKNAIGKSNTTSLEKFHLLVKERLNKTFEIIRNEFPNAKFIVCLSGGMDSSIIAYWAKNYLPNLEAYCFSFLDNTSKKNQESQISKFSDDHTSAEKIAKYLNIKFNSVIRENNDVINCLPKAIQLCQDWRDFNVHCAIVNLFLAETIRNDNPDGEIVILTGDLMNEFVCDYKEEIIDNVIYYPQPKVSIKNRRRFFIKGLDAGDREVGIFSAFNLVAIQPYAATADLYLSIPAENLEIKNIKKVLNLSLLPEEMSSLIGSDKTRAQIGGKEGGVLRICHESGIENRELLAIWARLLNSTNIHDVEDLINAGSYRE